MVNLVHHFRLIQALFALPAVLMIAGCEFSQPAAITIPREVQNSIGMDLVLIPAGHFVMGSSEPGRSVDRQDVSISQPFYLGRYEVTRSQYEAVMGANSDEQQSKANYPADNVSWEEAVEFCRRLSQTPAEQQAGRRYRLPTEAEWEYACRAGTSTPFNVGDVLSNDDASTSTAETEGPMAVGSYKPNAWGLYDMHGNVWEWCADGKRTLTTTRIVDPKGPNGLHLVVRGGAWDYPPFYARSDYRQDALRGYVFFGFRVVCSIDQ